MGKVYAEQTAEPRNAEEESEALDVEAVVEGEAATVEGGRILDGGRDAELRSWRTTTTDRVSTVENARRMTSSEVGCC